MHVVPDVFLKKPWVPGMSKEECGTRCVSKDAYGTRCE